MVHHRSSPQICDGHAGRPSVRYTSTAEASMDVRWDVPLPMIPAILSRHSHRRYDDPYSGLLV